MTEISSGKKAGHLAGSSKQIVKVLHNNRVARFMLDIRPPAEGYAWLKYEDDGKELFLRLRSGKNNHGKSSE